MSVCSAMIDCLPPPYDKRMISPAYTAQCPVRSKGISEFDTQLRNIPQTVRKNIINVLRLFNIDDLKIDPDHVYYYLEACRYLPGLCRLQERCEDILLSSLGIENAVYMLHMAKNYDLPSLSKESKIVICSHLANIMTKPGFTTLEKEQVQEILEIHFKTFGCQSKCISALEAWGVNADSQECDKIRQFVRDMQVSSHSKNTSSTRTFYITFTVTNKGNPHVIVRDVNADKLFHSNGETDMGKQMKIAPNSAVCSYQSTETDPPYLVVSGGIDERQQKRVFACDIVRNKWKERKAMSFGRQQHSLCVANSKIYAIGGYNRKKYMKHLIEDIEEFDPHQNKWRTVSYLEIPVHSCVCATIDNDIYIIGGKDDQNREVPYLQVFNTQQWRVTTRVKIPVNCTEGMVTVVNRQIYLATFDGRLLQINTKTADVQALREQPITSDNFSLWPFGDNLIISYHGPSNTCEIKSYVYNVAHDCWLPYDTFKMSTCRVVGQCEVAYPDRLRHVPFCD